MDFNILKKAYDEIMDGHGFADAPSFETWLKWNGIKLLKKGDRVHSIGVELIKTDNGFDIAGFTDTVYFDGMEVYTDQDDEGGTYWYYFLDTITTSN